VAILAVVDEFECFDSLTALTTGGQAVTKDSGQRGGFQTNFNNPLNIDLSSSISDVWVRFRIGDSSGSSAVNPIFKITNSVTGKDSLRFLHLTTFSFPNYRFVYNSTGTTYATLIDLALSESDTNSEMIIHWKRGVGGRLQVWINGTRIVNLTGTYNTPDTAFNRITFIGTSTSTSMTLATIGGAVIVADEPIFDYFVDHISPDGAGTYSEWTGSYTNVDDAANAPYWSTATDINVNATGQRFLASYESMDSVGGSREIAAVNLAAHGVLESGSVPTSIAFKARLSGTDYTLNSLGFTATASNAQQLLTLDPAGNVWTPANVNAVEFGAETA
jgi:hypothetical protein